MYSSRGGGYRKNSTKKLRSVYKGFQMDSGSERKFAELLDHNNINWIKNNKKFFIYYDKNGKERKYYPDFYLPDYGMWVEIKAKFYETENIGYKLAAVDTDIELIYHDDLHVPEKITNASIV